MVYIISSILIFLISCSPGTSTIVNNNSSADELSSIENDSLKTSSEASDTTNSSEQTVEQSITTSYSSSKSLYSSSFQSSTSTITNSINSSSSELTTTSEICNDTIDNDLDGKHDCFDSDCVEECIYYQENSYYTCNDKIDNDSDGLMDCQDEECFDLYYCLDTLHNRDLADSIYTVMKSLNSSLPDTTIIDTNIYRSGASTIELALFLDSNNLYKWADGMNWKQVTFNNKNYFAVKHGIYKSYALSLDTATWFYDSNFTEQDLVVDGTFYKNRLNGNYKMFASRTKDKIIDLQYEQGLITFISEFNIEVPTPQTVRGEYSFNMCKDGIDNDEDGDSDCCDSKCSTFMYCFPGCI